MKNIYFITPIFLIVLLLTIGPAISSDCPSLTKLADAQSVLCQAEDIAVEGSILQVIQWLYSEAQDVPSHAIVLKLKDSDHEFLAYMGPKRFLENRGINFEPGETLKINGTMANVEGQIMIIARSYSSRGEAFTLRDIDGKMAINR
ncbi:MAG: hypothetical protein C0609_09715 [Deltaproteobacteria bacterium]|nr:MAG: hypothetical protein C0609_09715 [Deltaproteobacteria bacterium]